MTNLREKKKNNNVTLTWCSKVTCSVTCLKLNLNCVARKFKKKSRRGNCQVWLYCRCCSFMLLLQGAAQLASLFFKYSIVFFSLRKKSFELTPTMWRSVPQRPADLTSTMTCRVRCHICRYFFFAKLLFRQQDLFFLTQKWVCISVVSLGQILANLWLILANLKISFG